MSRYIDADARDRTSTDMTSHENKISYKPTADVVEVVRCKDCKWYVAKKRKCMLDEILIAENDYCSYGERREDE